MCIISTESAVFCSNRELEDLTFFDSGPKPEWTKEKAPGFGRLDFLRPGEGKEHSCLCVVVSCLQDLRLI